MAAPTSSAERQITLANGEPSTHGANPSFHVVSPSTSWSQEARVEAMTESEDDDPRPRHLEDMMLSAIWTRLEQAGDLATASDVMDALPDVAALADETAILARALELLRRTESEG